MPEARAKVAVVGVVGRTNAGKSTLVNQLVGEKVSIVSPVEQTTRNTVRGIVSDPRGQLVLLDTPGLHKAVGELGRLLNRMARRSAAGTDVTCVVFDASEEPQLEDVGWMQRVARERPERVVFVLNKADILPQEFSRFRLPDIVICQFNSHQSALLLPLLYQNKYCRTCLGFPSICGSHEGIPSAEAQCSFPKAS